MSPDRKIENLLRRLGVLIGVATLLVWSVPPYAGADPVGNGDVGGVGLLTAPTLSLEDLGSYPLASFYGESSTTMVSFTVPVGLVPVSLNMTVDLPFNMRSGVLIVTQNDRVISKLGLPLADMAPLVIPLAGVEIVDDAVSVTLTLSALPADRYCLDWMNPVRFVNGTVTFAGTELVPATIADFLPGILRKVTIAVPSEPTPAESDAAVQLAASLVARYRGQAPQISVVPLAGTASAPGGRSQPMERRIIIKEGPDAGLTLGAGPGVPVLTVSGPSNKLTHQAKLLTDGAVNLAVSAKAVAGELRSRIDLPGDSATLAQLGQPGLTGVGVAPQVSIALDQTRFGHPSQGYRVHLMGSYTPVPPELGAQLTATVNGKQIDRWSAETAGVIDHWVDIPDELVDRYTQLVVAVDTAGNTGRCGEFRPINLTIDGATVVLSTPALPPIPPGFRSLPQALMPEVQVGLGTNSFADTVRAAQIAVGMQRLSVVPLSTKVTTLQRAIESSRPAILISSDGWNNNSIALPVSANDRTITVQALGDGDRGGDPTSVTLDRAMRFGSLQTVFDTQRTLLIATSTGASGQLDELLRWLEVEPQRWSQLRGSAIVAFPGREPTSVTGRTPVTVYGPLTTPTGLPSDIGRYQYSSAWWVAAGVVVVAAGGALAIVMGARRSAAEKTRHIGDAESA